MGPDRLVFLESSASELFAFDEFEHVMDEGKPTFLFFLGLPLFILLSFLLPAPSPPSSLSCSSPFLQSFLSSSLPILGESGLNLGGSPMVGNCSTFALHLQCL